MPHQNLNTTRLNDGNMTRAEHKTDMDHIDPIILYAPRVTHHKVVYYWEIVPGYPLDYEQLMSNWNTVSELA